MNKTLVAIVMLTLAVCGCATVLRDCRDIDQHVGERVVLVGELIDYKVPMIHGVHVGYRSEPARLPKQAPDPEDLTRYISGLTDDHAVVYHKVRAEGVLIRVFEEFPDPFSSGQITNLWWQLVNPQTGRLADYDVINE